MKNDEETVYASIWKVSKGKSKVQNISTFYLLCMKKGVLGIHMPFYLCIHKEMLEVYIRTVTTSGTGGEHRKN